MIPKSYSIVFLNYELILDFQGMHSVGVKKGHKIMSKGASLKIKRTQCSLKPHKQYF